MYDIRLLTDVTAHAEMKEINSGKSFATVII